MSIYPPTSVLTANGGGGTVHMEWQPPVSGVTPDHYDVYMATSEAGTKHKVNFTDVEDTKAVIYNVPFGQTVFTAVKSIGADGCISEESALARDGTLNKVTGTFEFAAPVDDWIPEDSIFAAMVGNELVAFEMLSIGTVSGV